MANSLVPMLNFDGFDDHEVDKVQRLLKILKAFNRDDFLNPRLALHGGTALNVFRLGMPRLSVDLDLGYIGNRDRAAMLAERPLVESRVQKIGRELGYRVAPNRLEHAGRSFKFRYPSIEDDSVDYVKVDLNFIDRSNLLAPRTRFAIPGEHAAPVMYTLRDDMALIAGKLKALVSRVVMRDLYDVNTIAPVYDHFLKTGNETLNRRVVLYNLAISDCFPFPFEVANRFRGHEHELDIMLGPVLRRDDKPDFDQLVTVAEEFVAKVSQPQDAAEHEFLERAARADFAPRLLFADHPYALDGALNDPVAKWKFQHLEHKNRLNKPTTIVPATNAEMALTIEDMIPVIYSAGKVFDGLQPDLTNTRRFVLAGDASGLYSRPDLALLEDLRDAATFLIANPQNSIDADYVKAINSQITRTGAVNPGEYRKTEDHLGVKTRHGRHMPAEVNDLALQTVISDSIQGDDSISNAIALFANIARAQPFADGNKRTALLTANGYLIDSGTPSLLTIPHDDNNIEVSRKFKDILGKYYIFGDLTELAEYMREWVIPIKKATTISADELPQNLFAVDSDLDGLTDGAELVLGTDPMRADTDGDGLQDGYEVAHLGTNPRDGAKPAPNAETPNVYRAYPNTVSMSPVWTELPAKPGGPEIY